MLLLRFIITTQRNAMMMSTREHLYNFQMRDVRSYDYGGSCSLSPAGVSIRLTD